MRYALVWLTWGAAFAQDTATAKQILENVRAAYTGVQRCQIAGSVEMQRMSVPFRMVFERPDRLRIEGSMGGMAPNTTPGGTMVTDSKTTWRYDKQKNTYTRQAGPPELDVDMDDGELKGMGIDPASPDVVKFSEVMLGTFRRVSDLADRAKVLRTEALNNVGCYVIEEPGSGLLAWIDMKQYRILRMEIVTGRETVRMNFPTVSLNEPLPSGVFSFVPPAGARLVDSLE